MYIVLRYRISREMQKCAVIG